MTVSSLASSIFMPESVNPDVLLGRKALGYVLAAISLCVQTYLLVALSWWLGILMIIIAGLIGGAISIGLQATISDEAFGFVGAKLGAGYGSVRNLFSRKAAKAA